VFSIIELLSFSLSLFIISLWGIFVIRKNLIVIFIAFELMALSISLMFIFFSLYLDDILGQLFALLIISVIGAESAIGLSLLLSLYRLRSDISLDVISNLKG